MKIAGVAALVVLCTSSAFAQREVAPFVGIQSGGQIVLNGDDGALEPAPGLGAMLSFRRTPQTWLDLVVSLQSSSAVIDEPFAPYEVDTLVSYAHVGGRYVFNERERVNPYIAATLGATWASVAEEDALAISFAFGGGADVALTQRTKLRLDARYYSTISEISSSVTCEFTGDGACSLLAEGANFNQLAATAGLAFRF